MRGVKICLAKICLAKSCGAKLKNIERSNSKYPLTLGVIDFVFQPSLAVISEPGHLWLGLAET